MLKRIVKWAAITLAGIVAIVIVFYLVVYFNTESRINKVYSVQLQKLDIPVDSVSYERGKLVAINRGCLGCHGANLALGEAFMDEHSPLGRLYSANISSGKGGIKYKDEDWIRVLRHGLNQQNKSVWFMPSHTVSHISNEEMADLICFLKQQPPVDKEFPSKSLKPLGRILTFLNKYPLLPAEMIDHNATYKATIEPVATPEYGRYLATTCTGCHEDNFKGGPARSATEPARPDITSTGHAGKWSEAEFFTALRTGKKPDGKLLSQAMPWSYFKYSDTELKAIYLYLHQLN